MIKTGLAVVFLLLAQGLFEYKLVFLSNHGLLRSNFCYRVPGKRLHCWKIFVTTDSRAKLMWNKRCIRFFEIGILDLYVIWTLGLIMFYYLKTLKFKEDLRTPKNFRKRIWQANSVQCKKRRIKCTTNSSLDKSRCKVSFK